jgi:hypothetical protein
MDATPAGGSSAEDRPIIGRVGIGLGTRSDRPAWDVSTPEKLKQTLLGADTLSFNKVQSGNHFVTVLERLGIAEILKPKIVRTSPTAIFEPVLKSKGKRHRGWNDTAHCYDRWHQISWPITGRSAGLPHLYGCAADEHAATRDCRKLH